MSHSNKNQEKGSEPTLATEKQGSLRIWFLHDMASDQYSYYPVDDVEQAIKVLEVLYKQTHHLQKIKVLPNSMASGGLDVFGKDGWQEWLSDYGLAIDELPQWCSFCDDEFPSPLEFKDNIDTSITNKKPE